jgi:putative ABC transport system permease protein
LAAVVFRNCLAAALRAFARSGLYSAISVFGLAIGLGAAILVGLIARNETRYDHFLPGYERIYLAGAMLIPTGHPVLFDAGTPSWISAAMAPRFAAIEAITRVSLQEVRLKRGGVEAQENIYWADPNVFDVLHFPTLAGNLQTALRQPDSIVVTRSAARKYFGRDAPLGAAILLNDAHPMKVTAVIADLPDHNTQFESGVFASGTSSYSRLTHLDNDPGNRPDSTGIGLSVRTYLRLSAIASVERLQAAMPEFLESVRPGRLMPAGVRASLRIMRIDQVHLSADLNPGVASRLIMIVIVGALILVIAAVNFINLTTARAARRALEVGIRKASGAGRWPLIAQFLGESVLYTSIAAVLAIMGVELLLPAVNSFLQTGATFAWWREAAQLAWIATGALLLALLAGSYPAWVLSAFRPVNVLKARSVGSRASLPRLLLVGAQFAILIGLVIAAGVVYEQRIYATHAALRVNADQILVIRTQCGHSLEDRLRNLPGVLGVVCSDQSLLTGAVFGNYELRDGSTTAIDIYSVEPGIFALLGLEPVAGRIPPVSRSAAGFVINETAARRLGFPSADAAIGQFLPVTNGTPIPTAAIAAVTPDFAINAVDRAVRPSMYLPFEEGSRVANMAGNTLVNVKLTGRDIPRTLIAIDQLLTATNPKAPINRQFLNDYIQSLYVSVQRQEQALAISAAVAVVIACLGLVGLSASMAERRTKEIGIRKAMGANTSDILRLLLWQFAQPVLGSIVIAWIIAGAVMNRWLHGFAYHVELDPWLLLAAAGAGLAIALSTVGAHCYLIARARPVAALRYE